MELLVTARTDSATPPGDEELVARMARGDEGALGALYDRWAPRVFAVAARLLGRAAAEEVVEETFWQAWREAPRRPAAPRAVSAWLLGIGWARAVERHRAGATGHAPAAAALRPMAAWSGD